MSTDTEGTRMTAEQAAKLREPFLPEQIGKLPKPFSKDSKKGDCKVCGGYHGLPAAHLDYVGHAATTDRLLQVDRTWSWEPLSWGPDGLPLLDPKGGLWIKLTVCGVTRLGYGDAAMGHGMKEIIGDAIRNAAMRFGVALDLWSKEDLLPKGDDRSAKEKKQDERSEVDVDAITKKIDAYATVTELHAYWKSLGKVARDAMGSRFTAKREELEAKAKGGLI